MQINKTKYRGICFMQEDKGRDTEIVIPIVHAAEKFLNCEIEFALKWNAHLLYKGKFDFVIIPANCIGSLTYHQIAKYAHEQGIRVFSFISEGNFMTDAEFNFFGFNNERWFYQENVCAWNKRTFNYFRLKHPGQAEKVVLTGAPGFDRYTIYDFADRHSLLKKYGKERFEKVISYSGWAFGKLQYPQGVEELEAFTKNRPGTIKWVEDQRVIVRDILKVAIEKNPDILFVLKQHPAEYYPGLKIPEKRNEMTELAHYANVLYIEEYGEDIHDLISITDILLGFETTTAIETWLMKPATPTIFINEDPNFPRVDIYKGCVIVSDAEQLNSMIGEYYAKGKVSEFENEYLQANREKIIENTIGFSDGLNHLRSAYFINKMLLNIDKNAIRYKRNRRFFLYYIYFRLLRPFYSKRLFSLLPKISKTAWVFERYKLANIELLRKRYAIYLDEYYRKTGLDSEDVLKSFWQANENRMLNG